MNKTDLVRIHHAEYQEDIPFWLLWTENNEPVLEIGCGHGRVALPLLAEGREVVGIDIDQDSIQTLRDDLGKRGLEMQQRAQFIHEDILNFQPERSFGAVIVPCNTYSTFSLENRLKINAGIFKSLRPGGIFAASMPSPVQVWSLYNEMQENADQPESDLETSFPHPDTGYPVQVSSRLSAKAESLGWDWIYDHLHPDGQVDRFVQSTEHYLTSLDAYQEDLIGAGFDELRSMGDFDCSEYSENSPYLILVAKKPVI